MKQWKGNWPAKRGLYQGKSKWKQNTNIKWKATKMQVKHRGQAVSIYQEREAYINGNQNANKTQISNERQQKCKWNTGGKQGQLTRKERHSTISPLHFVDMVGRTANHLYLIVTGRISKAIFAIVLHVSFRMKMTDSISWIWSVAQPTTYISASSHCANKISKVALCYI